MGNTEVLNDIQTIVIPHMTTAVRNTVVGNIGMLIYDSTQNKLCFKKAALAAAASWELITSVQEA